VVPGAIVITGAAGNFITGISSQSNPGSEGTAGHVHVEAGSLALIDSGRIISDATLLSGPGGAVDVVVTGDLLVSGRGIPDGATGIFARTYGSRDAGRVTVSARNIELRDGGLISSSTFGTGNAGGTQVTATSRLSIDSANGGGFASGIVSNSNVPPGQVGTATSAAGNAGLVRVHAGSLMLSAGGRIGSQTQTTGAGGNVSVTVPGAVSIDGAGTALPTGILANAEPGSMGAAGVVGLEGGAITLSRSGQVASTAAGEGRGGAVTVAATGNLLLDGGDAADTQISASATGTRSGNGGTVSVSAATITIRDGARIASSTAGDGRGGDVRVAADEIRLSGAGSQITATSTGMGDAGSITVAARRLALRDGASISTAAKAGNGGNITISLADMLHLQRSAIVTSVRGALGNGGNISIDPQFVILDRSLIQADAVGGNGGNIRIIAGHIIQSADSAITATSQLGLSGQIGLSGPPPDLNGSLVVLASDLRAATAVLSESCSSRGADPQSSLVAGRQDGMRHVSQATLPALYFVHRPVRNDGDNSQNEQAPPLHASIDLAARCN
jgi:large exoprotein involved in heme utilization and adhesion